MSSSRTDESYEVVGFPLYHIGKADRSGVGGKKSRVGGEGGRRRDDFELVWGERRGGKEGNDY